MGRCTGHCCRFFCLDDPYEEIQTKEWQDKMLEGEKIAEMVIPLGVVGSEAKQHYYTCKYFDGANCTNYENRPLMCSAYPHGRGCGVKGCTSSCAKESGTVTHDVLDLVQLENAEEKLHLHRKTQ